MQKAQKLAIKLILSFLVFYANSTYAQEVKDAYKLLDKIIQLTRQPNDDFYFLSKDKLGSKVLIKKYYDFRFYDKPFYTVVTYDSLTDKIGYDTLKLEKDYKKWKAKYSVLDSLFSKSDIERIMETNYENTHWESNNKFFNKKRGLPINFCNPNVYCDNYISISYLNEKKDHVLIIHSRKGMNTTFFIFKRENKDWTLVNRIDNVGW